MGDLGSIFVLALAAMLTPTLLAAATVMMLLPDTKRLMLGYLLGAYLTSISLGLLIVFSLHDSGSVSTARSTLTPAEDLVLGAVALVIGLVLRSGRVEERRHHKEKPEKESWPQRLLGRGSPRVAFAVGAALTLPGASYLVALKRMSDLEASTAATVLLVVSFCVIQLLLLELPLIGYVVSPQRTEEMVTRFRDWTARKGRQTAAAGAIAIGLLLLLRGVLELIL
jgi:hypothetical protein